MSNGSGTATATAQSPSSSSGTSQQPASSGSQAPTQKPKRHAAATSKTNTYGELCSVKFVYEDDTNKPIANRFIAYWLFDSSGKSIDSSSITQQTFSESAMLFPVGVGKTDAGGILNVNCMFNGEIYSNDSKGRFSINTFRNENPSTQETSVMPFPIRAGFPIGRKVGFILCPIDMLKSIFTGELIKLTSSNGTTIAKIAKNEQTIQLRCTLPDWQYRIETALSRLRDDNEKYDRFTKPHLEALGQLEMLASIVSNMERFPGKRITSNEFNSASLLSGKILDLQETISNRYVKGALKNSDCRKLLDNIDASTQSLLDILISNDFNKEFRRYTPQLDDGNLKGGTFEVENDWRSIFESVKAAYSEIAKTNWATQIFDEHVAPFLVKVAHYGVEGTPEWTDPPASNSAPKDTPLLVTIDKFTTIVQFVATPAPGPVSLVEGIIDVFGLHISRYMKNLPRSQVKQSRDLLYGVMKMFNGGKSLLPVEKATLAKAAYAGKLADGRKALYDFTREYMAKSHSEIVGKLFCRAMFLFSLISLYNVATSDEKDTLKKWLAITSAGTNAAATAVQTFFAKYLDAQIRFGTRIGIKVGTAAGSIAAIGGIAAAIISYQDAQDAFAHHETTKGYLLYGSAIGSALLSLGYLLMTVGAGSSWIGGIGIWVAAIGAIISVAAAIALLVIDLIEEGTKQAFKGIFEDFSKEGSTYRTIYHHDSNNPSIESCYKEIEQLMNSMDWWDLSWRAAVPLYSAGFKMYSKSSPNNVSYDETSKMIGKMIRSDALMEEPGVYARSDYSKEGKIVDYLYDFLQVQKTNVDLDNDGIPDAVEWIRGTIYNERQPGIFDPNPQMRAAQ